MPYATTTMTRTFLLHLLVVNFLLSLLIEATTKIGTTTRECLLSSIAVLTVATIAILPQIHALSAPQHHDTTEKVHRKSVLVTPVSLGEDRDDAGERRLIFHDESDVTLSAVSYEGPFCKDVAEGMETLVEKGFAVFDSEDAMFATLREDDDEDEDDVFGARWMKETLPSEFQWATTRDILAGACGPFAAFSRRFHSALASHRPSTPSSDYYVGSVTLCGPITRGRSGEDNNVYSLHRDPCFLTSLYTRQEELRRASEEAERELLEAMEERKRRDIENGVYVEEEEDDDEDYEYEEEEEERVVDPICAEVLRVYGKSTAQGGTDDTVTVRQVNFWLPHEPDGSKHLVFLSREASGALASLRAKDDREDGEEAEVEVEGVVVSTGNGNQWLTEEGLRYVEEEMPEHVFVTNRPLIFVSGNAKDLNDPLFHCGAVVGDGGEEDQSCSTEIRIAVCSRRKEEIDNMNIE